MGDISKNFSFHEYVVSASHPEVAKQITLTSTDKKYITILTYTIMQPIRDYIGAPIIITSGKRDSVLNNLISGAASSDHLSAMAVDFTCNHHDDILLYMRDHLPYAFGQCIIYPRFIHISLPTEKHHGEVLYGK